jgi:hypothetical protein
VGITHTPQYRNGKNVEAFLDQYFRLRGWSIRPTTSYEERVLCLGDRHFSKADMTFLIEYKSGLQTAATGNLFLETVSVDRVNKPGWVYTCQADFIFYAALLNQKILIFRPHTLRRQIDMLKSRYREVSTKKQQNDGYNTLGVLVPFGYATDWLAEKVISL